MEFRDTMASRSAADPTAPPQAAVPDAPSRLVRAGAAMSACALTILTSFDCIGLRDLDTMTLLPAAACAGAAAASLGVALACWRELRGA